jgi:small multidrug resistance pump
MPFREEPSMTAWVLLVIAIVVEVASTASLPKADGFRDPGWTATVLAGYGFSIWLLALAVREIPVSVAYAVWSGLGTAGIAVIATVVLGEPMGWLKAAALTMVVAGVVILNLQGSH